MQLWWWWLETDSNICIDGDDDDYDDNDGDDDDDLRENLRESYICIEGDAQDKYGVGVLGDVAASCIGCWWQWLIDYDFDGC